jgi:hypothetical protein
MDMRAIWRVVSEKEWKTLLLRVSLYISIIFLNKTDFQLFHSKLAVYVVSSYVLQLLVRERFLWCP